MEKSLSDSQEIAVVLSRVQDKLKTLQVAISKVTSGDVDQGGICFLPGPCAGWNWARCMALICKNRWRIQPAGFEDLLVENLKLGASIIGYGNLTFEDDRRLLSKCANGHLYKKLR